MKLLDVDHRINKDSLKKAFQQKIRLHHTDKGGDAETAKAVTLAYRLLCTALETGRRLPRRHTSADLRPAEANNNSDKTGSTTSNTAPVDPSRTQPARRRRRAYPFYAFEDHMSNSFNMFMDEMNDNLFSSQYYDVNLSRIFDDVLPRFSQRFNNYRGFF
uniref:J domain-containing protein n=2 Tax=Bursaphelenchus xylophilus TaxID=6326 RepID=A0A1I7S144_BURXY